MKRAWLGTLGLALGLAFQGCVAPPEPVPAGPTDTSGEPPGADTGDVDADTGSTASASASLSGAVLGPDGQG